MARISRKELKRDELLEATKEAENWLEHNWRLVLQIVGVLAVVGAVVGGWFWYASVNRAKATVLLQDGLRDYERAESSGFADSASLETALTSFEAAGQKGGSASVGLVAEYYRGVTLHRLGRGDEAIPVLTRVGESSAATPSLGGSASAMLAEVYAGRGESDRAIAALEALVAADPPTYPVDQALLELAGLYAQAGDTALARETWKRIIDDFPARGAADEARRRLGA
jgi:tetratricopeptide (TPR) repeat protein